jgi:hypothetical protein
LRFQKIITVFLCWVSTERKLWGAYSINMHNGSRVLESTWTMSTKDLIRGLLQSPVGELNQKTTPKHFPSISL